METAPYHRILRRVGWVLLAVALVDAAVLAGCMKFGVPYSTSVFPAATLFGIFLLRGSLRAASVLRWLAVFLLAVCATELLLFPLLAPLDLWLTTLRLQPGKMIPPAVMLLGLPLLSVWLIRELGREPVQAARDVAGRKRRDLRIPAALGTLTVAGLFAVIYFWFGSSSAAGAKARALAEQKLGHGYRYHVDWLKYERHDDKTSVFAWVTAWNDREIIRGPISWSEP